MGWTDAYNYLRNGAAKLAGNQAPRTDGDLPLGARIGSVVGIQQSPLLSIAMLAFSELAVNESSCAETDPPEKLLNVARANCAPE